MSRFNLPPLDGNKMAKPTAKNKLFSAVNWSLVVSPRLWRHLQSTCTVGTLSSACLATDLVLLALAHSFDVGEKKYQSVEMLVLIVNKQCNYLPECDSQQVWVGNWCSCLAASANSLVEPKRYWRIFGRSFNTFLLRRAPLITIKDHYRNEVRLRLVGMWWIEATQLIFVIIYHVVLSKFSSVQYGLPEMIWTVLSTKKH